MFSPLAARLRLKESEDARSLCIAIEGLECSEALCAALTTRAESMTKLYREINGKVMAKVDDATVYAPLTQRAMHYSEWYKSRKKVAMSMKSAATGKSTAGKKK